MSRRKAKEENIRSITRSGRTSLGIILPVGFLNKLHWRERQKVVVRLKGTTLLIRDWWPKRK